MTKRLDLNKARELGFKYEIKLLSEIYVNNDSKLQWLCPLGHTFSASYKSIVRNGGNSSHGCGKCANRAKLTIEEVRERALTFGMKLLSNTYKNNHSKLHWECLNGHKTYKKFNDIHNKKGCIECAGNRKKTTYEITKIGLKLGFKLLSADNYINNKTPVTWLCSIGHTFNKCVNAFVQGQGCSVCSKKYDKAQSELYQYILGMYPDAVNDKPGFLKSKRLRLDIYIPSLRKAIELDGEYWHSFPEAIERDARKDKECQEAGIQLLRIKHVEHWHRNKRHIGEAMIKEFLMLYYPDDTSPKPYKSTNQ